MNAQVIIVGGGIAGLTTALALGRSGIECIVLERTEFEDDTGAGIQLTPNATYVLFELGLEQALREIAHEPQTLHLRHWRTGSILSEVPLREVIEKYCSFPYFQVLRSDLIKILRNACEQQPNTELNANVEVQELDQCDKQARVRTSVGDFSASVVVGADGVHSTVSKLIGNHQTAKFSGWQAWRSVVHNPNSHSASLSNTNVWCGTAGHIVHYPIGKNRTYNCVFVTKSTESLSGKWKQAGAVSDLADYFRNWNKDVIELIDQIKHSSLFRWGLYHHARLNNLWNRGRVVLLGDAIHATMPFLAQGAALAIEDALAFANRLRTCSTTELAAIDSFVENRRTRTRQIQIRSEQIGKIYHLGYPLAKLRDWNSLSAVHRLVKSVYAFESD